MREKESDEKVYTVALSTLGCKVSQYETEAVKEAFLSRGFSAVDFSEKADVYVINTCTVTAESDRKCRQVIRRAIRCNPDALVMVMGCYAQRSSDEILKIEGVAYIAGTNGKMEIPEEAEKLLKARAKKPILAVTSLDGVPFEKMSVYGAPRTRAYLKIEDGCECKCAYCAIPSARGGVRSKAPGDVLSEIETLAMGGTREVVLTGIETASYGADLGSYRLIDLLEDIEKKSSVPRIRLGSLTPEMMKEDTVLRLSRLKKLVPHFHLSMQSGSSGVLKRMKRRYNAEMALAALERLRAAIPSVQFTTDMMVGFPGESEEEFAETLAFTEKARFLDMHVFAYSRRKDTEADGYKDQIPEAVKRDRSAHLIALAAALREEVLKEIVKRGKPLTVLFETNEGGVWHGHSDEFAPVAVKTDEDLHGEMRSVLPLSASPTEIVGELI